MMSSLMTFIYVLCILSQTSAFLISPHLHSISKQSPIYLRNSIEYQSTCGRGEQHLSASLLEGNLVVFQGGTWLVDGVEVGDGTDPYFRYAMIETMQLVWTHNCEHGVLRGLEVEISADGTAHLVEPLSELEFGPEQLIAHIPVDWDEANDSGKLLASIRDDMWKPME